jgi:hypothetical protein
MKYYLLFLIVTSLFISCSGKSEKHEDWDSDGEIIEGNGNCLGGKYFCKNQCRWISYLCIIEHRRSQVLGG